MTAIDEKLKSVFARALRCDPGAGNFSVGEVGVWDSLTHIKLIMELEIAFGITISPEEIPVLYADFNTVRDFIAGATSGV